MSGGSAGRTAAGRLHGGRPVCRNRWRILHQTARRRRRPRHQSRVTRRVIRCAVGRRRGGHPGRQRGALFGYLAGSKHSVVADAEVDDDIEMVHKLLAAADAVVWSAGSKLAEHRALARRNPPCVPAPHRHLDHALRPGGSWRDRAATEFTLQAWSGGIVGLGRGLPERAPVFVGGQVGEYLAGPTRVRRRWRRGTAADGGAGNSSTCRCWRRRSSA